MPDSSVSPFQASQASLGGTNVECCCSGAVQPKHPCHLPTSYFFNLYFCISLLDQNTRVISPPCISETSVFVFPCWTKTLVSSAHIVFLQLVFLYFQNMRIFCICLMDQDTFSLIYKKLTLVFRYLKHMGYIIGG